VTTTKTKIDSSIAPTIRHWIDSGRGVRIWHNAEIGNNRPDMFTPADNETPPHWVYPVHDSEILDPANIVVETFTETQRFRGRLKRYYWGYGLAPATEAKAKRLAGENGTFLWEYDGYGLANVIIGTIVEQPFTA